MTNKRVCEILKNKDIKEIIIQEPAQKNIGR